MPTKEAEESTKKSESKFGYRLVNKIPRKFESTVYTSE